MTGAHQAVFTCHSSVHMELANVVIHRAYCEFVLTTAVVYKTLQLPLPRIFSTVSFLSITRSNDKKIAVDVIRKGQLEWKNCMITLDNEHSGHCLGFPQLRKVSFSEADQQRLSSISEYFIEVSLHVPIKCQPSM